MKQVTIEISDTTYDQLLNLVKYHQDLFQDKEFAVEDEINLLITKELLERKDEGN